MVTNTYDTLGRVRTQKSAAGNLSDYYFAGSRSEEVGPGGSSRTNYIDGEGNLLQVSDPMGNWTLKDYDGQNRLVRETRPEGNRAEYAYDDATCALPGSSYVRGCTHNVVTVSRLRPHRRSRRHVEGGGLAAGIAAMIGWAALGAVLAAVGHARLRRMKRAEDDAFRALEARLRREDEAPQASPAA